MTTQDILLLQNLRKIQVFSRADVFDALKNEGAQVSKALANYKLQRFLKEGSIIRVGRNQYHITDGEVTEYSHIYSKISLDVVGTISNNHPLLDFRVFELVQLNEFVNHLIAHNVLFISTESDYGSFVFQTLKEHYPGKVLLYPDQDMYHNYVSDDSIIITRLISESPRGTKENWNTRPEKFLVDLISDKWLAEAVNHGEYKRIFEECFQKYAIDETTMFRYARRRGANNKLKEFIQNETSIKLRTV